MCSAYNSKGSVFGNKIQKNQGLIKMIKMRRYLFKATNLVYNQNVCISKLISQEQA